MKSVAQEGRKAKPIPPQRDTDRKTSRTNVTSLKPAKDFFFFFLSSFPPEFLLPFCPSFYFYSFFPPSFLSFFIPSFCILFFFNFKLKKNTSSFLSFYLFLFLLPSFLPFLFLPPSFLPLFSSFPTGDTIKPGAGKTPELDPNRGHPNNRDNETNFTLLLQRTCKMGAVNTSTPAGRGNPPTKKPPTNNNRRR